MSAPTESDAGRTGDRRERGLDVYAEIFAVPRQDVLAAFDTRVGLPFAEEQLQAAGGAAWAPPCAARSRRRVVRRG
jgi:hypothetical protein